MYVCVCVCVCVDGGLEGTHQIATGSPEYRVLGKAATFVVSIPPGFEFLFYSLGTFKVK